MGWSGTFEAALAAGGSPKFVAEVVSAPLLGGLFSSTAQAFNSHAGMTPHTAYLSASGFRYSTGKLDIQRWAVTGGGGEIDLALTAADGATLANLRRGMLVSLKAVYPTSSGTLYSGVLWDVVSTWGREQRVTLVLRPLTSSLVSRLIHSRSDIRLFEDLAGGGTRTRGLSTGSWSPGTSTLPLGTLQGDWTQVPSSGKFLVLCDPGGTAGTPKSGGSHFFIRASTWNAGSSQIESIDNNDVFGTTRTSLVTGDPCYLCYGVVQDDPIDAALKVITSTGASLSGGTTNGGHDVLPIEAGCGFPSSLVDYADAAQQNALTLDSSSAAILVDLVEDDEPQSNPRAWVESMLNPQGVCLVQRQGQLTFRVCQDPATASSGVTAFTISDGSLEGGRGTLTHHAFAPSLLEAPDYTWTDANGYDTNSTSTLLGSLPVRAPQSVTVPFLYGASAVGVQGVRDRVKPWVQSCLETVSVDLHGLSGAELCPGDLPTWSVSSRYLRSLRPTGLGVSQQRVLVQQVSVSLFGGRLRTRVDLAVSPEGVQ